MRVKLGIAYDGTNFSGWAKQPALRTVQGTLEDAIARLFVWSDEPPLLTVAGRTDAGVHATGQVAHLDLTEIQATRCPPESLAHKLNGVLGTTTDVVVTSSEAAAAGFDARFAAEWRRYEYRIADASCIRDPLERHRTVWYPKDIDVDLMTEAAQALLGLHDFASFCKPRDGSTTIRTLQEFGWQRQDDGVVVATIKADAFCHSMVRALVGACVAVGEGRLDVSTLVDLRDAMERTSAFKVMPAHGLVLVRVGYPEDDGLAARTLQTRAKRA